MRLLQSDAWLARRAAAGDERAFATIFQRYHQDLYRFCLSILGRPEDAQDSLQNTMVKALRSLPGERREIQLKPWLYRVAHNESIDLLRRRREGPDLEAMSVAGATELTETVAQRERLGQLLADLETLPDRQRSGLVMRELAGLDYAQIAEAFGTSPSVVRQTVYEARVNLRELEAGREMSCDLVTKQISEADGRHIRRRDIQAHLRACPDCRAFRDAIESRRGDLSALTPLPAVAAGSILQGLLGAGHGGAGIGAASLGAGAGAGKAVTASVLVKSAATVAAVATIGVSAADRTGLINAGLPGGPDPTPRPESTPSEPPANPATNATGEGSGAEIHRASPSRPAAKSEKGLANGAPPAEGHEALAKPGNEAEHSAPAAAAAKGELPAASSHGQQTAASHGGGRAAAKGKSKAPHGAKGHPAPPAHPTKSSSKPDTRPESPPAKGKSPDNPPPHPLQPSQAQMEPGPLESAAGHGSKENR